MKMWSRFRGRASSEDELSDRAIARIASSNRARNLYMHEAAGVAGGAITGGVLGAMAGAAGAAAGAIIGAIIGALAGRVSEQEQERTSLHDSELDATIGISGGDLGAPGLKHPPSTRGAYSAGTAGGGSIGGGASAGGPISSPGS